tara:strand:+ start:270 stop:488 length:219 start_codon:yes stop_codon:yes gene_type:complete
MMVGVIGCNGTVTKAESIKYSGRRIKVNGKMLERHDGGVALRIPCGFDLRILHNITVWCEGVNWRKQSKKGS